MGGTIPVKTIEEIKNYIEEQEQNGALLVTGKWGSGKTYLMRQIERELNQGPQYLMAVVSLFGIEDTNTLTKKVKEAVVYAQTFNKAEKSGKGHIAKGVNAAKQLSEKAAAFGELFDFGRIKKLAKSANVLLSIDVYDFLPIEKEVYCIVAGEEQPVKKKLVLVFDDFERCKIGVIDLLGIINTYVEDKGIKTVIIASEDNIEDEENYKTFKEKVVERTVKLDVEYRRIQQEMIGDYKAKTNEYTEFLKTESPKLFQVFEESETRNLRTFKSCLIDFERVYGLWHSLKLPTDGMGEALYVFAVYLFEVKGGNYKKMDEYDEYYFNFLEEKAEDKKRNPLRWQTTQDGENSKYKRYNAQYRIQPLIRWMIEGEWNEQRIKAALNQRFSVKETAPEREVLDKAFWELSQEIIDRGLPQVLQQAYDGKLTMDDYVALLGRLDDFRKIGVPIQCDVDDARLLQGFHNRYEHYMGIIEKLRGKLNTREGNYKDEMKIKRIIMGEDEPTNCWGELFYTTNIDIIGLGLTTVESDIWWLLTHRASIYYTNYCNMRKYMKNQITYYDVIDDLETSNLKDGQRQTYLKKENIHHLLTGAHVVVKSIQLSQCNGRYEDAYYRIIQMIKEEI